MARRSEAPTPPRRVEPDLPAVLADATGVRPRTEVFGARVTGLTGDVEAAHSRLIETVVAGASVSSLDVTGATLTDVRLTDLRATRLLGRESQWRGVDLDGGRIGTVDLLRAALDGVTITGLRVDYLSLASATCRDVRFVRCEFGALDLPEATLQRVAFDECRADEVETRGLRGTDLDLRGLEALSVTEPAGLRGATLTERQIEFHARAFAAALGVKVLG